MAATVHIPAHWRYLTDGVDRLEVEASTLRGVVAKLGERWPELTDVIMLEGRIRSEIAIAINNEVTDNNLIEPVPDGAEVHLIPAISGG